jgi:hypothetical protein
MLDDPVKTIWQAGRNASLSSSAKAAIWSANLAGSASLTLETAADVGCAAAVAAESANTVATVAVHAAMFRIDLFTPASRDPRALHASLSLGHECEHRPGHPSLRGKRVAPKNLGCQALDDGVLFQVTIPGRDVPKSSFVEDTFAQNGRKGRHALSGAA